MRITSGGNVGIGTASPTSYYGFEKTLSIESAGNAEIQLKQTTNTNYLSIGITNGLNYFQSTQGYDFQIGGGSKMKITSGGNVLIGTATDGGEKLQVLGSARISGNGTYTEFSLKDGTASGSTWFLLSGFPALGDFTIREAGVANHLVIKKTTGAITLLNLAGTGSRAVLADANGLLSAPVSDSSVKENIKLLDYGIATIMKLKPVSFEYIKSYKNFGEGKQIGNIAQDVAKVIPEAVFTTPSTGKMGINYDQLNGVYIKALQELQEQINILKLEIQTLENK
jgi:hypothetical protein